MKFTLKVFILVNFFLPGCYVCAQAVHRNLKKVKTSKVTTKSPKSGKYEVWGSDQSNSVPNASGPGTKGSFLYIWDSDSIQNQLMNADDAKPLSCTPNDDYGPCDLLKLFPQDLVEYNANGTATGNALADLPAFGRLHGVLKDPSNGYITANIFTPKGGYVGVIDTKTKEAIALFRVTEVNTGNGRSVHLSEWSHDGSAIIIANLHGKMMERINVVRNEDKKITHLRFDRSASVFLGKSFALEEEATYFNGPNAFGNPLIGSIVGSYDDADTGDFTPTGACKESSCSNSTVSMQGGSRPNNVPIYPFSSANNNIFVTLGGGGLIVLKADTTPMQIVGEYGNAIVNGAGLVSGPQVGNTVFINSGVSASSAGFDQSTFTMYAIDDSLYKVPNPTQNFPMPVQVFKDPGNTNTIGNIDNTKTVDNSGQLPNQSTRRDAHGPVATIDGKYVHVVDRIQNNVEVFKADTYEHVNTYDLVSRDGKSGRYGPSGPCYTRSVTDDPGLMLNDPAPDLLEATPDGKYLMIAFRGPKPITVSHAAQGSCPGVGIVELTEGGRSGRLVDVLRATNTIDNVPVGTIVGGHNYTGVERADVHGAIVVSN